MRPSYKKTSHTTLRLSRPTTPRACCRGRCWGPRPTPYCTIHSTRYAPTRVIRRNPDVRGFDPSLVSFLRRKGSSGEGRPANFSTWGFLLCEFLLRDTGGFIRVYLLIEHSSNAQNSQNKSRPCVQCTCNTSSNQGRALRAPPLGRRRQGRTQRRCVPRALHAGRRVQGAQSTAPGVWSLRWGPMDCEVSCRKL